MEKNIVMSFFFIIMDVKGREKKARAKSRELMLKTFSSSRTTPRAPNNN